MSLYMLLSTAPGSDVITHEDQTIEVKQVFFIAHVNESPFRSAQLHPAGFRVPFRSEKEEDRFAR